MEQSSPVERALNDSLHSTQKAQTWIRNGWIATLFSAFVTLLLALAGATGTTGLNYNLWNLLDVFLMTVLAFGVYQRSRVAATSMFVYFLVSKICQWVHSASVIGIGGSLIFVYFYLQAMRGTFRLSPPLKVNRPLAFSVLLAFLSLALVSGPVWREESLGSLVKRIQPAVVTIIAYDAAGQPLQQGSGFFVSKAGQLITNRHVLDGASRAEVQTRDGKGYAITGVMAEDKERDLVQVATAIPMAAVRDLPITDVVPEVGERVVVVGSPQGLKQTVSNGLVSAVRDLPGLGTILQISAPISSGSSGSPVVNLKGEVIGVASLQMMQGQNLNFAMPAARVLAIAKEGQNKKVPPLSWEEFVETDPYKELPPEKKAEARQRYKEIYGQTFAEWTAGLPGEQSAEAEKLFVMGGAFLLAGDYAKALSYFKQVVRINPRHAKAWVSVGFCSDKLGRYQEEITALQQAIHLQPDLAGAPLSLGRALGVAYGKLRRYQEALAAFQQADPPSA